MTAPAPSPNSTQVVRSLKSRMREKVSAPTTSAVRFAPLEDVIAANLDQLFTGMDVHEHTTFRVTRNEDVEVEEDDAENLLTAMEQELTRHPGHHEHRKYDLPALAHVRSAVSVRRGHGDLESDQM